MEALNDMHLIVRNVHGEPKAIKILYETLDCIAFRNTMDVGEHLKEERHDVDEIIFRVAGTTRHRVGTDDFIVRPGDHVKIPRGTLHSCVVVGNAAVDQVTVLVRGAIPGSFFTEG
ncbi:cupin domain-containing protein [Paraburkholderia sp. 31.1]|uniref:cupin domain-containing protein n=2 Tax=unclassified Paraburkholderia TaxID=2615204 RepID=UPI001654C3E0|nr:cupin domain-containing protein [Paraburkholderia sp. 31.1]MBC8722946.1 cupin domain-containing protein [Paraburkholderia sp. 31.1]